MQFKFLIASLAFLAGISSTAAKVVNFNALTRLENMDLKALGNQLAHLEHSEPSVIKAALHEAVIGTELEIHFLSSEDKVINRPVASAADNRIACDTTNESPEIWIMIYTALLAGKKGGICKMHPLNDCNLITTFMGAKIEFCGKPYKFSLGCELITGLSVAASNECVKDYGNGKHRTSGRSVFGGGPVEIPAQVRNSRY
ncbi:hypothetical protein BZA05DRAFT_470412 [Tricharina praecox]|uniref:uncharacterized protein n=1 Tax=Tricharina praecox TaxID=43433 RepID=UPI002220B1E2|nr:uncharacterized protein BZA05DRAFT_470412 [Tricharina praecox]KAI5857521.1 hypothetical protein BZA05DRAFT_470412 [Tricharina praecox]